MRRHQRLRQLALLCTLLGSPLNAQMEIGPADAAALREARKILSEAVAAAEKTDGYCVEFAEEPLDLLDLDRLILFGTYLNQFPRHYEISREGDRGLIREINPTGIYHREVSREAIDHTLRIFLYLARATVLDAEGRRVRREGSWVNTPLWRALLRSPVEGASDIEVLGPVAGRGLGPHYSYQTREFALDWFLFELQRLSSPMGPPTEPTREAKESWFRRVRACAGLPSGPEGRDFVVEESILNSIAIQLMVLWRVREAIPELHRLGDRDGALWLDLYTTDEIEPLLRRTVKGWTIGVLEYMRDHPDRVPTESRRAIVLDEFLTPAPSRPEFLVEHLIELGLSEDQLGQIAALIPSGDVESGVASHRLGVLAVLGEDTAARQRLWETLEDRFVDDRDRPLGAASRYLVATAGDSAGGQERLRQLLRQTLEHPRRLETLVEDEVVACLGRVGTLADVPLLLELGRKSQRLAAFDAIARIDREAGVRAARVLSEVRRSIDSTAPLHMIAAIDSPAALPLLAELEAREEMAGSSGWIQAIRAQLAEQDPDRRARLAATHRAWLSDDLAELLVESLRARGAQEESIRPLVEWKHAPIHSHPTY